MQPDQQQRIMGYFIEEAKDHLNTIEQGLLNLQSTIEDAEMVNEVFRAAHSVKGGAAMLGLNGIQKVAHRLEDFFKILKETPVKIDQKLESLFLRAFDALQELLTQLQGPFGLTEDTSNTILAGVEPTFDEIEQHLAHLATTAAIAPPVAVPRASYLDEDVFDRQPSTDLEQLFRSDVTTRLREMLQLFKQPDNNPANRQQLQDICRSLASLGEQYGLDAWCHLLDTARRAIAHPENSYRILAPIVIKDIKQAQDLVLKDCAHDISPCLELQNLVPATVPDATIIQDDLNDLLADISLDDLGTESITETTDLSIEDLVGDSGADLSLSHEADNSLENSLNLRHGPEVGMAELNTLADLFEGESPDLGMTWQEEEVVSNEAELLFTESNDNLTEESVDFSDLLFDDSSSATSTSDSTEDDLSDLFGDSNLFGDSAASNAVSSLQDSSSADPNPELDDFADLLQISESPATSSSIDLPDDLGLDDFEESDAPTDLDISDTLDTAATDTALTDEALFTDDDLAGDLFGEEASLATDDLFTDADFLTNTASNAAEDSDLADLNEFLADTSSAAEPDSPNLDLSNFDEMMLDFETDSLSDVPPAFDATLIEDGSSEPLDTALDNLNDLFGGIDEREEQLVTEQLDVTSTTTSAPIPDPWGEEVAAISLDGLDLETLDELDLETLATESESIPAEASESESLADLSLDELDLETLDAEAASSTTPLEDADLADFLAIEANDTTEANESDNFADLSLDEFDLETVDETTLMPADLDESLFSEVEALGLATETDTNAESLDFGDAASPESDQAIPDPWEDDNSNALGMDSASASLDEATLFESPEGLSLDELDLSGLDLDDSGLDGLEDTRTEVSSEPDAIADSTAEASAAEAMDALFNEAADDLSLDDDFLNSAPQGDITDTWLEGTEAEDFNAAMPADLSFAVDESNPAEQSAAAADDLLGFTLDVDHPDSELDIGMGLSLDDDLDLTQGLSLDDAAQNLENLFDDEAIGTDNELNDALELEAFTPDNELSFEPDLASDEQTEVADLDFDNSLFEEHDEFADTPAPTELDELGTDPFAALSDIGDLQTEQSLDDLLGDTSSAVDETVVDPTELDLGFDEFSLDDAAPATEPMADLDDLLGTSADLSGEFAETSMTEFDALTDGAESDQLFDDLQTDAELDALAEFAETSTTEFDVLTDGTESDQLFDDLQTDAELDALADLDAFSLTADEAPSALTDDFADLGFDDRPATSEAAIAEADDLDALLNDDTNLATDEFGDLEALLNTDEADDFFDTPQAALNLTESAGHQDNLSETDDFADLEALLEGGNLESGEPETAEETSITDSEFDDLDDLLKEAEEKMGGSPSMKVARGALPQARRTTRPGRVFSEQTMRVPVKHLDNLSNLVGELVVNRNSLEQDQERLRQSLDNLLYQVQQLGDVGQRMQDLYERSLLESSLLASRQGYRVGALQSSFREPISSVDHDHDHANTVEYDPLEMDRFTGFHSLSQEMIELIVRVRESSSDIEFIVDETEQVTRMFRQVTTQLQEGLTRSRMVPFAQTADRLPRAVRDISLKVGKQAELVVEGRETLIDKMILEQLYDPMTHLVNNAITHGIESPDARVAAGKPPAGRIVIRAFHQGNQTIISVSDDGAGIDVERVKAKAIEKGLISAAEARSLSKLDAFDIIFHPGFSTKDQADDYSGRGVGMDVVRTSLSEIRGVINTDSNPGKGTTFTIRLPLTLSISKALCCISDRARIAFPMDGVEDMLDVPKDRIQTDANGQASINWRDTILPVRHLTDLLGYNRHMSRGNVYGGNQEEDIVSVVVLRSAGTFLALQVDQVLGEQEIVIKQLEGPVPKPVGVAGATVLGDGRIMPIADVLELIDLSMGRIRRDASGSLWEQDGIGAIQEPPTVKTEPMVLIVDDSITVRELLSMTFNKVGYRVEQARDGQEAWEKLRSGLPCDIVFCDIEMPRMDGLELLSRIQKDPNLKQLPIAMLTSRGADRHRQMAATLGASGYFTKPYLEEALLDAAQRMLKGERLLSSNA